MRGGGGGGGGEGSSARTFSRFKSKISLFFSWTTRLWCILWKSRSLRNLSHVPFAAAEICFIFSISAPMSLSWSSSCWLRR